MAEEYVGVKCALYASPVFHSLDNLPLAWRIVHGPRNILIFQKYFGILNGVLESHTWRSCRTDCD